MPPPPFPQVDTGGGCYREKFFLIFIFWFSLVHRMSGLKLFFWILHSLFLSRKIFLFFQNIASTRQVFTRYSLSAFIFSRFILVWLRFGVYFISLRIMASIWFSITILTSLLIFDSHRFRLISALSILRFNSSACYKQTFMLMQSLVYACFGYFKAFWRVFVCFRCSLSSWVKIMRQKA